MYNMASNIPLFSICILLAICYTVITVREAATTAGLNTLSEPLSGKQ